MDGYDFHIKKLLRLMSCGQFEKHWKYNRENKYDPHFTKQRKLQLTFYFIKFVF